MGTLKADGLPYYPGTTLDELVWLNALAEILLNVSCTYLTSTATSHLNIPFKIIGQGRGSNSGPFGWNVGFVVAGGMRDLGVVAKAAQHGMCYLR